MALALILSLLVSIHAQVSNDSAGVNEQILRKHVIEISDDGYEGRGGGYPGERKAANYIAREFELNGLTAMGDKMRKNRSYLQRFFFHPRTPELPFQMLPSQNVVGFVKGSDRLLSREIVVVGCHYDGQGKPGQADAGRLGAIDDDRTDAIWNSADDNATSVAVLLEVVRIISLQAVGPKRSILFIAFGAEEHALNGSTHYVANPSFQLDRHVAMLNLEKLGRIPNAMPITASSGTGSIWEKITVTANKQTGMSVQSLVPELIPDTDHYPFAMRKIPAMVIGMAHEEDTHRPTDSSDKISFDRLAQRAGYVLAVVRALVDTQDEIRFVGDLKNELGFMPLALGLSELQKLRLPAERGGFKISSVIPGSAAEKADLRTGDAIVAVDGRDLTRKDNDERMFRIKEDSIKNYFDLTIIRKGALLSVRIRFPKK